MFICCAAFGPKLCLRFLAERFMGWVAISTCLTATALKAAIASRHRRILKRHGFFGSMSRRGHPYDNAQAESFMKTLKV